MKKFNQFVNESDYEEYRKPFELLIDPVENYIIDRFKVKDVEVQIYKEDIFAEDLFTISVTYSFPDTYAIDDISKCIDSTMKNVNTLKNMKKLEEVFEASESSNTYLNSTHNRFKFYILMEKIDSNFFKSLKGLNKFKI